MSITRPVLVVSFLVSNYINCPYDDAADVPEAIPLTKIVSPGFIRLGDVLVGVNHFDLKSGKSYEKLMQAMQYKEIAPLYPGERKQVKYSVHENMLCLRFLRFSEIE